MRRCWGITRNLNRCGRSGPWKLFCGEHRRQPIVWASFFIFTVAAGTASIYSALHPSIGRIETKNTNPQPILSCILDKHPNQKGFLLFTVKNEGLVDAKSVSVYHLTMRYILDVKKIRLILGDGGTKLDYNEPGQSWIFIPSLAPNKVLSKLTGESVWPDDSACVNILYYHMAFLTPDMVSKEKACIFFAEGNRLYSYEEYKAHEHFSFIDNEIKRVLVQDVPRFHTLGSHKKQ